MEKIQELKSDISEMEKLIAMSSRQKVKDILTIEMRKLITDYSKLEAIPTETTKIPTKPKHYEVKINNYAWDQTSQFVKFYITLKDVQTIPVENITCTFTKKSLELKISNLDNKNYVFNVKNLLNKINEEKSVFKVKTDMIIVSLYKEESVKWSYVTELEKKVKDNETAMPEPDSKDPSDGLMSIMKNMYDKGDDNMKRTIAQAWSDSQNKQSTMPMPPM